MLPHPPVDVVGHADVPLKRKYVYLIILVLAKALALLAVKGGVGVGDCRSVLLSIWAAFDYIKLGLVLVFLTLSTDHLFRFLFGGWRGLSTQPLQSGVSHRCRWCQPVLSAWPRRPARRQTWTCPSEGACLRCAGHCQRASTWRPP